MSIEIKVPQLPESVADATLVTWHKQVGQAVTRDENLADLETDKVVLEVPAPVTGVLKELRIVAGTSVTSGQVLAVLEEGAAAVPAKATAPAPAPVAAKSAAVAAPAAAANDNGKLAPSVRRMVEEKQLDPSKIPATGRDGRITKMHEAEQRGLIEAALTATNKEDGARETKRLMTAPAAAAAVATSR